MVTEARLAWWILGAVFVPPFVAIGLIGAVAENAKERSKDWRRSVKIFGHPIRSLRELA